MIKRTGKLKPKAKRGKTKFQYKERSPESVKRRAEQTGSQFIGIFRSGIDTWRPKDGENCVRFLPPQWPDAQHYGYDVYVHRFIGAKEGTYVCPAKMKNERCPICDAARQAQEAGEEEEAKSLTATKQVAAWIIDRDEREPKPRAWSMSWTIDRDISAGAHQSRTGKVLMVDHPDIGYDVTFKRTGKGLRTQYVGYSIDREETPISDDADEQEEILSYIMENPIPDCLVIKSFEDLEAALLGEDGANDDEDEDEEEKPARGKKSKSLKKGKRPADEEEDDDEEDEEERPRRGRSSKKGKHPADDEEEAFEDDDEDADDEDDDEDEEDKPARGKKSKSLKKGKRPADEEEDDDEEDDDEDDDEEEKPRRGKSSKKGKRPADEEEDDDEEDDDEDDDEEEKPRRGKGGKGAVKKGGRPPADDEEEDDDEEDDDEDDDEEEEKPRRGKASKKAPAKGRGSKRRR